ncbi:MAG: asparagine--tRNA ligase [Treponema sp.]|jgi:asparaginyl-tRNA synthetase|nr:asparagine--tRNA ligase [Treponema sp.]
MFDLIKDILRFDPEGQPVVVRGWVRTKRELKNLVFVEVNDGSCFAGIQCAFDKTPFDKTPFDKTPFDKREETAHVTDEILSTLRTGASVEIRGELAPSPAAGQRSEVSGREIRLIGDAENYPLQKKRHSFEFLREIAHLRPRTNTFGAVARVRGALAYAAHEFFQKRSFHYIHTPIITANDAEGAGAMFQVTTLDMEKVAHDGGQGKPPDFHADFFGKKTFLTVSGQLEAETYATALSRVYTFGPTFRAENSNTARHLAEFWMVEPEAAFADLRDNMELAEDFLKSLLAYALDNCGEDLAFFDAHVEKGIVAALEAVVDARFTHISYTDAVKELEKHAGGFEFKPSWGCDLQSEHEKFLTEKVARGPVIVTDYPKEIKAFYMKMNDDGKTVRAMDVLAPRLGEIIGGSQREDNLEKLEKRMSELGMKTESYWWYLDVRRFGSAPHSGFGMGFDRLVQYVTGMANIRDVIPYPRAAGLAEF